MLTPHVDARTIPPMPIRLPLGVVLCTILACNDPRPPRSTDADPPAFALGQRAAHTATRLPDGRVFFAGGCITDGCSDATATTAWWRADGDVVPGPALQRARDAHTASLLADGRVLLVGGFGREGEPPMADAEVLTTQGTMQPVGALALARGGHAAAVLGDGRVLVAGGWIGPRRYTDTVELFDPRTDRFVGAPPLANAVDSLAAVALADGRVLVTGGATAPGVSTATAQIFDPTTAQWTVVDPMAQPRFKHAMVRLRDDRVLVIGGTPDDHALLASTEIFDPTTGRFAPGPALDEPRYKLSGGVDTLPDGRVVVAGGARSIEVLAADLAGWSRVGSPGPQRRSFSTVTAVDPTRLLVVGGYSASIELTGSVESVRI
jgi:hypothetical protein